MELLLETFDRRTDFGVASEVKVDPSNKVDVR